MKLLRAELFGAHIQYLLHHCSLTFFQKYASLNSFLAECEMRRLIPFSRLFHKSTHESTARHESGVNLSRSESKR